MQNYLNKNKIVLHHSSYPMLQAILSIGELAFSRLVFPTNDCQYMLIIAILIVFENSEFKRCI